MSGSYISGHTSDSFWPEMNRARQRDHGMENYARMDIQVWIAMGIFTLFGFAVGVAVNWADNFSYQRHLQFLRLEFDTRLGMHSPR